MKNVLALKSPDVGEFVYSSEHIWRSLALSLEWVPPECSEWVPPDCSEWVPPEWEFELIYISDSLRVSFAQRWSFNKTSSGDASPEKLHLESLLNDLLRLLFLLH